MLALAGCGGGSSGSAPMTSPDAAGPHPVSSVSLAYVTASSNDDDEFIDICDTYVCDQETQQPSAEAGTAVGAPIIYSTTGGPLPDEERAGQVRIGANVTPLPDWKRPERWSYPINGAAISTGRTRDGARAVRVAEYLIPHISGTRGLALFPKHPVLRLAEGTSEEHAVHALHAAALINSALPHDKRILIGPEAPPLANVDAIPDGQIFVDFAAKSDWPFSSEGSAASSTSYSDGSSKAVRAGHVWVDPDAFRTQVELVRALVREMLHTLGLQGHAHLDRFPESVLRSAYAAVLPTDNHVPVIDADGLLAIYTRLVPGAGPRTSSAASLAPWENESLRMHGKLDTPDGAAFGVAFRNGLARPWASGPEPLSPIAENRSLNGSATWDGALLGFTPQGGSVRGEAEITLDLASAPVVTGRADFTDLEEWSSPKWQDAGEWGIWGDGDLGYTIAVRGNTIRETGGDEGVLTGSFVGRRHEGAVGTLERHDLSAAFGVSIDRYPGATDIALGASFTGTIDSATDVDHFKVPVEEEGTLTISTTGSANPDIQVFDASGVEIPGRAGSWVVDITKAILKKGRKVIVELSGGNTGQTYSGTTAFSGADGDQPPPVTRPRDAKDGYTHNAWNVALGANTVHGLYNVTLSDDENEKELFGNNVSAIRAESETPLDFRLRRLDDLDDLRKSPLVFDPFEIRWRSFSPVKGYVETFRIDGDTETRRVTETLPDGQTVGASVTTRQTVFGGWGVWNYHEVTVQDGSFVLDLDPDRTVTSFTASLTSIGHSSNTSLPEDISATYDGMASVWDSAHPKLGLPGPQPAGASRRGWGHQVPMSLTYTSLTDRIDVKIEYKRAPSGDIRYRVHNPGSSFKHDTQSGFITGSFYGPNNEEVGGVFGKFYPAKQRRVIDSGEAGKIDTGFDGTDRAITGAFSAIETRTWRDPPDCGALGCQ